MIKKIIASPFFVFPAISCIFFWPLAISLLSFKNDALTYYYPIRTLISDALNNGELPLWTAFINMGYPIHADLQSGAWNPILWIFSFLTGYGLTAFHFEFLLYVSFSGIGFYYLCKEFGVSRPVAFAIAFAYQFSGFILDSAQFFTCISSACYLPFILLFFRKTLLLFKWKDALYTGIFLSLFLTGGYPSLFVFTCYLLLAYLLFFFFSINDKKTFARKLVLPGFTMVVTFLALSLPAILSFVEYLPLIKRGTGLNIAQASENSMHPASLVSLVAPFANTVYGFDTSWPILMQSIYIGILPLLLLLFAFIPKTIPHKNELRFFLVTACLFLLLSWGDFFFVHKLAFYGMPLVDNFRHPGILRLFSIFLLLLVVNGSLRTLREGKIVPDKILLKLTTFLTATLVVWGTVLVAFNKPFSRSNSDQSLISIFQHLSFSERFLIQLPFLILVLWLFSRILKQRKHIYWLPLLVLLDLFINVQLQMPVTVAGSRRFDEIEKQLGRNPVKFPLPENHSIKENAVNSIDSLLITGSKIPFLKKISRNDYFISPGNLSLQDSFYASPIRDIVFEHPVLYVADSVLQNSNANPHNPIYVNRNMLRKQTAATNQYIAPIKFSANRLDAKLDSTHSYRLIFLQNFYPGWKAAIDGKAQSIERVNITYMSVNVPKGSHKVSFEYKPTIIIYAFLVAAFGWGFILLLTGRNLFLKQQSAIRRRET